MKSIHEAAQQYADAYEGTDKEGVKAAYLAGASKATRKNPEIDRQVAALDLSRQWEQNRFKRPSEYGGCA